MAEQKRGGNAQRKRRCVGGGEEVDSRGGERR